MNPKSNSRIIFEIILGLIIGSILGYIILNCPLDNESLTTLIIIAS